MNVTTKDKKLYDDNNVNKICKELKQNYKICVNCKRKVDHLNINGLCDECKQIRELEIIGNNIGRKFCKECGAFLNNESRYTGLCDKCLEKNLNKIYNKRNNLNY